MYALVEIKGKQYKAEKGKTLQVDRFDESIGTKGDCDKVLFYSDGEKQVVGKPYIPGASIQFSLGEVVKGTKVRVYKYKKRKKYRLSQGHRQKYSLLTIEDIKTDA